MEQQFLSREVTWFDLLLRKMTLAVKLSLGRSRKGWKQRKGEIAAMEWRKDHGSGDRQVRTWYHFLSGSTLLLPTYSNGFSLAFNSGLADASPVTDRLADRGTLACWVHCTAFKMQDMRHRSFPTFNIPLLSYYYIMVMLFSWTLTNGTKSLQSSWTTVQEANLSSFLNS